MPIQLAICGGGPSGLVLANIFAREAPPGTFELTVLESGAASRDQGSGWDCDKAAIAALQRAGLDVSTIQRTKSDSFRLFRTGSSVPEMMTSTPAVFKRLGLRLPWDGLETDRTVMINSLVAALEGRADVRFGPRVADCKVADGRVTVLDRAGASLGTFDAVIDASGAHGALRNKRYAVESNAVYTGVTLVQGVIASPEESCSAEIVRRVGEGTALVCGPSRDGTGSTLLGFQRFGADPNDQRTKCDLFFPTADPGAVTAELGFRASSEERDVAKAKAFFAEHLAAESWEEDYRAASQAIDYVRVLPIFMHPSAAETVVVAGTEDLPVLCIGDALHALPPWSGKSGNFALADAADCASAFIAAAAKCSGEGAGAALAETMRGLEGKFMQRADEERPRAVRVAECYRSVWPKIHYTDWKMVNFLTGEGGGEEGSVDPWEIWGIEKTFSVLAWFHRRESWGMTPRPL